MCDVLCVVWVHEGVVLCDELCVVLFGVLCVLCVLCVVVVLLCWCFISLFLSLSLFLFVALSLSFLFFPSVLSSSFSSLFFLFLFSLPFSPTNTVERTDQPTRRPTLRHLHVIWRTAGAQQSVLSSPLPSLLPSLPLLLLKKKERDFFITGIFPARNLFLLQF